MCEGLVFCGDAGLKVDWAEDDEKLGNIISVPTEIYTKGCVQDVDDGLAVSKADKKENFGSMVSLFVVNVPFSLQWAEKIGYPVVIKASEGGGGKGIRKVESAEDFSGFFRQVCITQQPKAPSKLL